MEEEIERLKKRFKGIGKLPKAEINSVIIACLIGIKGEKKAGKAKVKITGSRQQDIMTAAAVLLEEAEEMENEEV